MSNIGAPLVENFMESCTMLEKVRMPDGLGGSKIGYRDGVKFMAVIDKDRSLQARVAEKDGVTAVYTVTTPAGVGLEFHEVFKRDHDGAVFRTTSDYHDSMPPKCASFAFEQVSAERWEIPS